MTDKPLDRLWTRAQLAPCSGAIADRDPLALIEDGALGAKDGRIAYIGPTASAPPAEEVIDCGGALITPGLIDCHTHIVHGGDRAREFEMRLAGASYEEIARAGGGIRSTVTATREADEATLVASALKRLDDLIAEGVTTIEVKSGYGLDRETERRMLQAARRLAQHRSITLRTTYLGAHAFPADLPREDYVGLVVSMIPELAAEGLADAVDGFCEGIAFSAAEMARVFDAAKAAGLPVKLHAEQLSQTGGTALAARYGALSADHVEYAVEEDARALAQSGTVAVLLPGAFYTLRETQMPPVEAFRAHGVAMALATDCNPGSSPLTSMLLTMNMGATLFRLTIPEILLAVTKHAAHALGLSDETGTLETGKRCDLAIWDVAQPAELAYRIGANPLIARVVAGQPDSAALKSRDA